MAFTLEFLAQSPAWSTLASVTAQTSSQGFDLVTFGRVIVAGLTFGSIYALVALGIVLIYKSSDVVNFGHGDMATFSTFISFSIIGAMLGISGPQSQLPDNVNFGVWVVSFLGTMIFSGVLGLLIERVFLRPLQKAPVLSQVMVTIGLGVLLYGIASLLWKADLKKYPRLDIIDGPGILIGSGAQTLNITRDMIASMIIGAVLSIILYYFFKYTLLGTAIRAMAQNPTAARLMGVNVGFLTGLTWMLAMMLAAIAGILAAPQVALSPVMMTDIAVKAFAAAVLGGITSLPGAVVGGLLIGIVDNMVGFYLPEGWRGMSAFLIIVVVLTIRPNGLFGRVIRKKV